MSMGTTIKIAAVIVAAGRGRRAGGDIPKQWQSLVGQRVLDHTLEAFLSHPRITRTLLVLHPDDLPLAPEGIEAAAGGPSRAASVHNGLQALALDAPDRVLIHDVARPCICAQVIDDIIDALDRCVAAAPAIPVSDALWTGSEGRVTGTRDRQGLFRAQTPQGFHFEPILAAHGAHMQEAADDVAVARAAGLDVAIVPGDEENLKITYPADFDRAARILEARHGHKARQRI